MVGDEEFHLGSFFAFGDWRGVLDQEVEAPFPFQVGFFVGGRETTGWVGVVAAVAVAAGVGEDVEFGGALGGGEVFEVGGEEVDDSDGCAGADVLEGEGVRRAGGGCDVVGFEGEDGGEGAGWY